MTRLNGVLRKLDISLDTAVSYLVEMGYEVEARPTTKISDELVEELTTKFK